MQHKLFHFHVRAHHTFTWFSSWTEAFALFVAVFILVSPASAAMRFQDRSLYILDNEPGATTSYTVSFRYMSPAVIGSVDLLFCNDPIPYHDCVAPTGLNVSNAVLDNQSGETGYSILSKTSNHIVLTRPPALMTAGASSYTFTNIVNPSSSEQSFSIRLRSHATNNAAGPQIDFGSVKAQVAEGIEIATQVPPMLIFCVAEEVEENCVETNDNYYTDMGTLSPRTTLLAQSQMAVGTNASGGFAITATGTPMSAGTNVINGLPTPTSSTLGTNQFGINLVANNEPIIGKDPEGDWANAIASPDYSVPNQYKFVAGDVVAYSPNVSLMKKFTVSYIVNSSENLKPGVYSTTVSYIASGRF